MVPVVASGSAVQVPISRQGLPPLNVIEPESLYAAVVALGITSESESDVGFAEPPLPCRKSSRKSTKSPVKRTTLSNMWKLFVTPLPLLPLEVQQVSKLTWEVDSLKASTVVQGDFYRHGLTRRSWQALPGPIGFGEIHDGQREWTTVVPLERRHSVDAVG